MDGAPGSEVPTQLSRRAKYMRAMLSGKLGTPGDQPAAAAQGKGPTAAGKLYQEAQGYGRDAGFVANIIMTRQKNPTRRLAGLVKLLRAGKDVRTAQFNSDTLLVDGQPFGWDQLEGAGASVGAAHMPADGSVPERIWTNRPHAGVPGQKPAVPQAKAAANGVAQTALVKITIGQEGGRWFVTPYYERDGKTISVPDDKGWASQQEAMTEAGQIRQRAKQPKAPIVRASAIAAANGSVTVSRAQHDAMIDGDSAWMKTVWPKLKKTWSIGGATVTGTPQQLAELKAKMQANPVEAKPQKPFKLSALDKDTMDAVRELQTVWRTINKAIASLQNLSISTGEASDAVHKAMSQLERMAKDVDFAQKQVMRSGGK